MLLEVFGMNFMQSRNKNSSMHKETRDSSDNSPDTNSNTFDSSDTAKSERKSVEDLLAGSQDVLGSSISQAISFTSGTVLQASPLLRRRSPSPSPSATDGNRNSTQSKETHLTVPTATERSPEGSDEATSRVRLSEERQHLIEGIPLNRSVSQEIERPKSTSKVSERAKKKSWYSVLYPTYKSRSEDFKKLFKEVPDDERLVVDYSCALQKDILVHGRLYVSQNFLCFYANIFRWETSLSIKWKDVTSITKEKTARVIPNAILVCTDIDKHFFTSFATRDKAYLMLFRVWQNALMDKQMQPQEMWQWVHNCYGDELGLTSDDEDYIDPYEDRDYPKGNRDKLKISTDSISEEQSNPESDMVASINQTSSDPAQIGEGPSKGDSSSTGGQKRLQKGSRRIEDNPNKHIPTDMSDTSDSEQDKNMDLTEQPECTSMHEGRQMIHTILPINVDILFNLLFSKSKFLENFHDGRKTTNMVHGDWVFTEEGLKQRTVTLTVALAQPVGPKSTDVTEVQTLRECSRPGQLYSVDIHSSNAGIPYADSFYATMHYCLVRTVDDHTMFSVHAQIKYKKSVWGFVKGFIEKNSWNGLEDFYTALVRALQNEYCIPPAKAKGRRPRRGNSSLQRPTDEPSKTKQVPFTTKVAVTTDQVATTKIKHESLSWFVIILLVTLILLNVILYLKLWDLETREAGRHRYPDFLQLKDPPKTHDDWIKLMQQQEALHSAEMVKWQKVLQIAVELLKKVSVVCEKIVTNATVLLQNSAMAKDEL